MNVVSSLLSVRTPPRIIRLELVQPVGHGIPIRRTVLRRVQQNMSASLYHVVPRIRRLGILLREQPLDLRGKVLTTDTLVGRNRAIVAPTHTAKPRRRVRLCKAYDVRVEVGVVAVGTTRLIGWLDVLAWMAEDGEWGFGGIREQIHSHPECILHILVLQNAAKPSGTTSDQPNPLQPRNHLLHFRHIQLDIPPPFVVRLSSIVVRHVVPRVEIARAVRNPGIIRIRPRVILITAGEGEPAWERRRLVLRVERGIVERGRGAADVVGALVDVARLVVVAGSALLEGEDEFGGVGVQGEREAGGGAVGAAGAGDVDPLPLVVDQGGGGCGC